MQLKGPGVYMPGEVTFYSSSNGIDFKELGVVQNTISTEEYKLTFKLFELHLNHAIETRFVRVKASNPMGGYLFTDEIIVK